MTGTDAYHLLLSVVDQQQLALFLASYQERCQHFHIVPAKFLLNLRITAENPHPLRSLDFTGEEIEDLGLAALMESLTGFANIEALDFWGNGLTPTSMFVSICLQTKLNFQVYSNQLILIYPYLLPQVHTHWENGLLLLRPFENCH
jgi:hypothetical protein